MESQDINTFFFANRLMATLFAGDDCNVSERAIEQGYFEKVYCLMMSTDTNLIKECLWGISNIVNDSQLSAN
jgi:hypothetical protein